MAKKNIDKYNFIIENYIKADKPKTQQQLADELGITLGAIKNYMYVNKLNKKTYYASRNKEVKKYFEKGLKVKEIAKLHDLTSQQVYAILKEV